ncbi:MAG: hypothetical protein O8C62_02725 [Candidatus Methanoperedens sp.]|nr:hypothetical protein [Candidatus Methanoperedens sp.]
MQQDEKQESIEKLRKVLKSFGRPPQRDDYSWSNPALNVIDCVLSLNRKYDTFVRPRIDLFVKNHPDIKSLDDLRKLIIKCGPNQFAIKELNYNDTKRIETLLGVIEYLIRVQKDFKGLTEIARLEEWANKSSPQLAYTVGVRGFVLLVSNTFVCCLGLKLLNQNVYIMRFVSSAIGKKISDWEALDYLERAATEEGLPLREIDGKIWQNMARSNS